MTVLDITLISHFKGQLQSTKLDSDALMNFSFEVISGIFDIKSHLMSGKFCVFSFSSFDISLYYHHVSVKCFDGVGGHYMNETLFISCTIRNYN